jgi:hypothetical protein
MSSPPSWRPTGCQWSLPTSGPRMAMGRPSGSCPRQRWDFNRGWAVLQGAAAAVGVPRLPVIAPPACPPPHWVVLKRSKLNVEEVEGTMSTPKLAIARQQLHVAGVDAHGGRRGWPRLLATASNTNSVNHLPLVFLHTDLLDVHLYTISNWPSALCTLVQGCTGSRPRCYCS